MWTRFVSPCILHTAMEQARHQALLALEYMASRLHHIYNVKTGISNGDIQRDPLDVPFLERSSLCIVQSSRREKGAAGAGGRGKGVVLLAELYAGRCKHTPFFKDVLQPCNNITQCAAQRTRRGARRCWRWSMWRGAPCWRRARGCRRPLRASSSAMCCRCGAHKPFRAILLASYTAW